LQRSTPPPGMCSGQEIGSMPAARGNRRHSNLCPTALSAPFRVFHFGSPRESGSGNAVVSKYSNDAGAQELVRQQMTPNGVAGFPRPDTAGQKETSGNCVPSFHK
jgi:hypothetical protein